MRRARPLGFSFPGNEPVFHGSNQCSIYGVGRLAVVVMRASSITCLRRASAGDHGQLMTIVIYDTGGGCAERFS